jgi:hypothetical protein
LRDVFWRRVCPYYQGLCARLRLNHRSLSIFRLSQGYHNSVIGHCRTRHVSCCGRGGCARRNVPTMALACGEAAQLHSHVKRSLLLDYLCIVWPLMNARLLKIYLSTLCRLQCEVALCCVGARLANVPPLQHGASSCHWLWWYSSSLQLYVADVLN